MHRECNYQQTPTNAHSLIKSQIIHIHEVSSVSAINQHPQGDIHTKEYKINISNSHIQYFK
jgi:hypothetical protein